MSNKFYKFLSIILTVVIVCGVYHAGYITALASDEIEADTAISQEAQESTPEVSEPENTSEPETTVEETAEESTPASETSDTDAENIQEDAGYTEDADSEDAEDLQEEELIEEEILDEELLEEEAMTEEVKEESYPSFTMENVVDNVLIKIDVPEGAFPEGTKVAINRVNSGAVAGSIDNATDYDVTESDIIAFDITFYQNDVSENLQPNVPISVRFENINLDADSLEVFHMDSEGSRASKVATSSSGSSIEVANASSFSIYVVVAKSDDTSKDESNTEVIQDTAAESKDTYYLVTYNFYADDKLIDTQILKADVTSGTTTESVQSVSVPEKDGHHFLYFADENGNEVADYTGIKEGIQESKTVNYYAVYSNVYYVFFMDNNGRVVETREGKTGDVISTDNVTIALSSEEGIEGWYKDSALTQKVESVTLSDSDITLYPNIQKGHYIYFNTGDGGSNIDPMFVEPSKVSVAPAEPTKAGYVFAGWYTDEECTSTFTFGSELSSDVTLYAKWTAAQTSYKIVIWKQSVNDSVDATEKTYDFEEMIDKRGTSGETAKLTEYIGKNYTGFHYASADESTVISGDGTSVINVYYDRDVMNIVFTIQHMGGPKHGGSYAETKTYTGLYGQSLAKYGYTWPSEYNWYEEKDSYTDTSIRQVYLPNFIFDDLKHTSINGTQTYTLYASRTEGNNTVKFYKENIDGSYTLDSTASLASGDWTFTFTNKFTGFEVTSYEKYHTVDNGHRDWWSGKWVSDIQEENYASGQIKAGEKISGNRSLRVYYTRKSYTFTYFNFNKEDKVESIKYEANIQSVLGDNYNYTPDRPNEVKEGYIFTGWYTDKALTKEYNFDKAMPANNVIVYAGWKAPECKVTAYLTVEGTKDSKTIAVAYNSQIKESELPTITVPEGYKWIGWATKNAAGKLVIYNFNTKITKDITLYPYYINDARYKVTYDANGGDGSVDDVKEYALSAEADIKSGSALKKEGYKFLYWTLNKDGSGTRYYAHDKIAIDKKNFNTENGIVLYANYVATSYTSLTYHANDGSENSYKYSNLVINSKQEVKDIANDEFTFTRDGYTFLGWSTDKDAASALYKAGEKIVVDSDTNNLYAIWQKNEEKIVEEPKEAEDSNTYTITIKANSKTYTYDGTAKTVNGFSIEGEVNDSDTVDNAKANVNVKDYLSRILFGEKAYAESIGKTFTIDGKTFTITGIAAKASETNAGTYVVEVKGTAVITDADGVDVTDKFTVNTEKGTLTIEKKDIKVTTSTEEKEYDGEPLTGTATIDGLAEADQGKVTIKATSSITEEGDTSNDYEIIWNDVNEGNYKITESKGTLTITKKKDDDDKKGDNDDGKKDDDDKKGDDEKTPDDKGDDTPKGDQTTTIDDDETPKTPTVPTDTTPDTTPTDDTTPSTPTTPSTQATTDTTPDTTPTTTTTTTTITDDATPLAATTTDSGFVLNEEAANILEQAQVLGASRRREEITNASAQENIETPQVLGETRKRQTSDDFNKASHVTVIIFSLLAAVALLKEDIKNKIRR